MQEPLGFLCRFPFIPRLLSRCCPPKAVQIAEGTILPEKYTAVKTEIKPDKTALKKAIQEGEEIAGVELVESRNISVK